jgi:hypothetical protein
MLLDRSSLQALKNLITEARIAARDAAQAVVPKNPNLNGFSKKLDNHWAAVLLWYTYYNFCRIHKSLRVTPAMEAGITNHAWEITELLA